MISTKQIIFLGILYPVSVNNFCNETVLLLILVASLVNSQFPLEMHFLFLELSSNFKYPFVHTVLPNISFGYDTELLHLFLHRQANRR